MEQDRFTADSMYVAVPRAAGIDVHKMQLTATVRLCYPGRADTARATRTFGTDPPALAALAAWLNGHAIEAATMEGTGVYGIAPFRAIGGSRDPRRTGSRPACQAEQRPQGGSQRSSRVPDYSEFCLRDEEKFHFDAQSPCAHAPLPTLRPSPRGLDRTARGAA